MSEKLLHNGDMPGQAVAYIRVSTTRQKKEGFSPESQKDSCKKLAEQLNLELIKFFEDSYSAKTLDRPGMIKLLKFCRKNKSLCQNKNYECF